MDVYVMDADFVEWRPGELVGCVTGCTPDGASCMMVIRDVRPFLHVRVPDDWSGADAATFVAGLARRIGRRRAMPATTGPIRRMSLLNGYDPVRDGAGKLAQRTWAFVRVDFSADRDRRIFRKCLATPRCTEVLETMRGVTSTPGCVSTARGRPLGGLQTVLQTTCVRVCAWVRPAARDPLTADELMRCGGRHYTHVFSCESAHVSPSQLALGHPPVVVGSFDIEQTAADGNLPKDTKYLPGDQIICVSLSTRRHRQTRTRRVVYCLGATRTDGPDADGVPLDVRVYETEGALLDALADGLRQCDVITGYNIFWYDLRVLCMRAHAIAYFRECRARTMNWQGEWEKCRRQLAAYDAVAAGGDRDDVRRFWAREWPGYDFPYVGGTPYPPTPVAIVGGYGAITELRAAVRYFGEAAGPTRFFERLGRHGPASLRVRKMTSAQMGTNVVYGVDIPGVVVLDTYLYIKTNNKLDLNSLDYVAGHFLGSKKIDLAYKDMFAMYKTGDPEKRRTIAEYCARDADLVLDLIWKLSILTNSMEMAGVCYTPMRSLFMRGQGIKVYNQLLYHANAHGIVVDDAMDVHMVGKYQGAIVVPPKRGLYTDGVITTDFASLYPSIMQAFNLCYTTFVRAADVERVRAMGAKVNRYEYNAGGDAFHFVDRSSHVGILPRILGSLLEARSRAKKAMKTASCPFRRSVENGRQLALKISANSVYGFTGALRGMMPCMPVAVTTTAQGRRLLTECIEYVEGENCREPHVPWAMQVLYGDTDSVMFRPLLRDGEAPPAVSRLWEIGTRIASGMTALFPSPIVMEMEAVSTRMLFMKKKRYIGLKYESPDGQPKPYCKGIVTARRDNSKYARNVMGRCVDALMDKDRDRTYLEICANVRDVLTADLDRLVRDVVPLEEYAMTVSFRSPEDYNTVNTQVELHSRMRARNASGTSTELPPAPGDRLAYIVVDKGPASHTLAVRNKAETLAYATRTGAKPDRVYYATKQLKCVHEMLSFVDGVDAHALFAGPVRALRRAQKRARPPPEDRGEVVAAVRRNRAFKRKKHRHKSWATGVRTLRLTTGGT